MNIIYFTITNHINNQNISTALLTNNCKYVLLSIFKLRITNNFNFTKYLYMSTLYLFELLFSKRSSTVYRSD